MRKLKTSNIYILIIVILVVLLLVLILRMFISNRQVLAYISSTDITTGENFTYADSTVYASDWLWEFGNGDTARSKSGIYSYDKPGVYKIRLTVDEDLKNEFIVNVKNIITQNTDSLVRIEAPKKGMQDETIVFVGLGPSKEWRWSMGETGIIDSRERVAFYTYKQPGVYEIELMTEDTKYPIKHTIQIDPIYMENDTTDILSLIGNDIKIKLQAITDGKPFNPNYNHVLKKYFCDNPMTMVVVNNDKKNDFYSYCQGLRTVGLKHTIIQEVTVVQKEENPSCLEKIYVTQYNTDDPK